jgi:MoaD family protein
MTIKLRFTAQIKDAVGLGSDSIALNENEKLQSLLRRLAERYGEKFRKILFDDKGRYHSSNLIVVNEEQVEYKENISLNDGDELILLSPVSGG